MMKKIFYLLIMVLFLFININGVSAVCYSVRNTQTGVITYTTDDKIYNNQVKEVVSDNICIEKGILKGNKVSCGNIGSFNKKIPEITSWLITVAEILIPVILVIFGTIDFVKAITGGKEDEIKKGQQIFIKRIIAGSLVFFIVAITKLLISVVGNSVEKDNIFTCIDCFISNKCS